MTINWNPDKPTHITRKSGTIISMICRGCGSVIQTIQEVMAREERRLPDGTRIRTIATAVKPNANYGELTMVMSDGSRHVTHGCKHCLSVMTLDKDHLQALHDSDINDLALNDASALPKKLHTKYISRRVVGVQG